MTQTAYPRFVLQDDRPTAEAPLSSAFHERFLAHFIGQRTDDGIWPPHSADALARERYGAGQTALYETKDAVEAIRRYEEALDADPGYLHAWVALAIAYITDNTDESLDQGERILDSLCALPVGDDGLSPEAASIIRQNRAYLELHRYRRGDGDAHLSRADAVYADAAALAVQPRIELLCPWAFVKTETGQRDAARALVADAAALNPTLVREYAAKYPSLATLLDGNR